jgi:DNA polymerase-1
MNRLVLIDGNAILHRAYHALPPLTAPDGTLVNAVYGFTSMLFKIFHDLAPSHIAVAFDRPKPTFRKKLFAEYQATRPKMDEELAGQIDKVHEVVRAFGIPIFEKDGFEADDIIGTLSHSANHTLHIDQTIIVTGDRDILQLVNDRAFVYMPTKGLSEAKLYMEKEVKEKLGVEPRFIADYKGLAGDSSDNYPGVSGIGPKTAVSLIETFGTIENLYKALKKKDKKLGKFSPSVLEKLTKGQESAVLSKTLATIHCHVKLDESLESAAITTLNTPKAQKILGDLHFHSLLKRLNPGENDSDSNKEHNVKKEQRKIDEQQQLF